MTFLISIFLFVGAAILVFFGLRNLNMAKMIQETPTTPIGQVVEGTHEVAGSVSALSTMLTGPLEKKRCAYFRFTVMEKKSSGKNSHWRTVIEDVGCDRLLIEDESGAIELEMECAELLLETDTQTSSGTFNAAPPEIEAVLQRYGQSAEGIIFNKTMRYQETILEVGDEMYALGDVLLRDGDFPMMTKEAERFLVSDSPESTLIERYRLLGLGLLGGAAIAVIVGGGLFAL